MVDNFLKMNIEDILNNISDGIVIVDEIGRTIWANTAWDRITGLDRQMVLGRRMQDVVGDGYYDLSVTEAVMSRRTVVTIYQKTVTGKHLISTGVPIFYTDQAQERRVRYIVICMRDITELKEAERKLRAASLENEKILSQLEEYRKGARRKDIVVKSKAMRDVLDLAERIAKVDSTVLLTGESGSGKGVVARYIHTCSPKRCDGPFVQINCGAIPPSLLESELFGYESGAFTGARREGKPGLFETADKGTLFLDEIGEFPLELQAKLLHVLQERTITRVGATKPRSIDVRIVTATNRSLEELVAQKKFRTDLYYRLAVIPVHIPSLKDRKDDIIPLAAYYLDKYNKQYGLSKKVTGELLDRLLEYDWPGNVRELSNTIERLVVTCPEEFIPAGQMDFKMPKRISPQEEPDGVPGTAERSFWELVADYEYRLIQNAVKKHGTQNKAAQALGISLSTLIRKGKRPHA